MSAVGEGRLLGVDPGTRKCGLVVLSAEGEVAYRSTVSREELPAELARLAARFSLQAVVVGDRTGASAVREVLSAALPGLPLRTVSEHHTTRCARDLYWRYHPPRGWRRLVPRGLLLPPEPLDGYAAELIARAASAPPSA